MRFLKIDKRDQVEHYTAHHPMKIIEKEAAECSTSELPPPTKEKQLEVVETSSPERLPTYSRRVC